MDSPTDLATFEYPKAPAPSESPLPRRLGGVSGWLLTAALGPTDVDCTTAVMLKILDGKCKMKEQEKVVMERLYDALRYAPGRLFDEQTHELIASTRLRRNRGELDESLLESIYEMRVLAETRISRPVMKSFKARIRQTGLFEAALRAAK